VKSPVLKTVSRLLCAAIAVSSTREPPAEGFHRSVAELPALISASGI
jgi:hypothetical protein